MSDIDDFMRNRKPTGKSKLDVYTNDILTLKNTDTVMPTYCYICRKRKT